MYRTACCRIPVDTMAPRPIKPPGRRRPNLSWSDRSPSPMGGAQSRPDAYQGVGLGLRFSPYYPGTAARACQGERHADRARHPRLASSALPRPRRRLRRVLPPRCAWSACPPRRDDGLAVDRRRGGRGGRGERLDWYPRWERASLPTLTRGPIRWLAATAIPGLGPLVCRGAGDGLAAGRRQVDCHADGRPPRGGCWSGHVPRPRAGRRRTGGAAPDSNRPSHPIALRRSRP